MTLWVHALGAYRTGGDEEWRRHDYLVRNLVKSLKGQEFNGYSNFTIAGKPYRIDKSSDAAAYRLISNWGARQVRVVVAGPVTLVPVPSSAQVTYNSVTCPARIAASIAALIPTEAKVGPWLRHTSVQQKAHEGGTRNSDLIKSALECTAATALDLRRPIILIDDVVTSGAHARACAEVLRAHGATVEHIIVAGRTFQGAIENPLELPPEDLEAIPDFDFDDLLDAPL